MKKLFINFSYLFLLCLIISCNNSVSPEMQSRFAIYLLKNDTLNTKDVEGIDIRKLDLNDKSNISYNDIIGYDFNIHKIYLKEQFSKYFGSDTLKLFSDYFGKPFIVIANGERIYLGSFHSSLSSWSPNTPKVVDFSINNEEKSFLVSRAPYYDITAFIDVRYDKRIYKALIDKIIK